MIDVLADLPGYLLRRASASMLAEFTEKLSPLKLRPTDASTLVLIRENPNITPSALGQLLGIQRANMVPLVAHLEKIGWVERVAIDGRSFGLNLTLEGEDICKQVKCVIEQYEQSLMARIPETHRDHLMPALKALWSG